MEKLIAALLENPYWLFLVALGIPALIVRRFEKKLDERERRAEERERNREKLDRMMIQTNTAALALGEATAKAVQRIPDAHCNGDMRAALEYAKAVKHEQKDFLTALGIHALHEE